MFTRARVGRCEILPPVLCTRRAYIQVAFLLLIGLIIFIVKIMSAMRGAFLQYHLESDTDGELVILPKEFSRVRGAACLDGSTPAFYYRQSAVPAVQYWIVHLQGGGWCTTAEECLHRSETALGSSLRTRMSKPMDGIMSSDCTLNPDFCMWHMVDLLYCDGGSFLGNRSQPLLVKSRELYLSGASVFDALIDYLSIFTPFKDAEKILLVGSSSGLGALIHADRLRDRLQTSSVSLQVLIDGGLFLDMPDINGIYTMRSILGDVYNLHHIHKSASLTECKIKMDDDKHWQCLLPEIFHRYVLTPAFFVNSLYDPWFRKQALKIDCPIELCPNVNFHEVLNTRVKMLQEGEEILQANKNGVFFMSCPVHSVLMEKTFFSVRFGRYTVQQGLGAWIHHRRNGKHMVVLLDVADVPKTCPNVNQSYLF